MLDTVDDPDLTFTPVPSELMSLWYTVRRLNEGIKDRSSCHYCGEPATCEDHVIPHSLTHRQDTNRTGYGVDTLPACSECNTLLTNHIHDSLYERQERVYQCLTLRYSKEIKGEAWTQEELDELGYTLRSEGEAFNRRKTQIMRRLVYMRGVKPITHVPYTPITTSKAKVPKRARKPSSIGNALLLRPRVKRMAVRNPQRWYVNSEGQWDCFAPL